MATPDPTPTPLVAPATLPTGQDSQQGHLRSHPGPSTCAPTTGGCELVPFPCSGAPEDRAWPHGGGCSALEEPSKAAGGSFGVGVLR